VGTSSIVSGFGIEKCQPFGARHMHVRAVGQDTFVQPCWKSISSKTATGSSSPPGFTDAII
jgi:hypothetical protein